MRTRVKICGITRRSDAVTAIRHGADAIGFVFWRGSPRGVTPEAAGRIGRGLPAIVAKVGVFVDASPAIVSRIVRQASLNVVQLHGRENPAEYIRCGVPIIKAVSLTSSADLRAARRLPAVVTLLVDARDPVRHGGTGMRSNWRLARQLARLRPILLAGGLESGNAAEAIATVRPWGLDVSSGVEARPGRKSAARIAAFFQAVARADSKGRGRGR